MSKSYFNRYEYFIEDGDYKIVPGIDIPIKPGDKYIQFKSGKDRFDKLSDEYYGSPFYGWLIMQANPLAGGVEFEIPENFRIRIPYPLLPTLQDYKKSVEQYNLYYGE